ncbi:MAG: extracellular solute-binding protein [Spirochaetaceae bacterium]|nr:extracellular solute-binding protein [Spirochaetaceae bacterium]
MKRRLVLLAMLVSGMAALFANGSQESAPSAKSQATKSQVANVDAPKPTLIFTTSKTTTDMSKEQPASLYKEVTGYDIKWESMDSTEQLMLVLASGEKKDEIAVSHQQFPLVLSEGAAMDLTDLIDQYGPDIKKAVPTLMPLGMVDGRIYGIPSPRAAMNFPKWFVLGRQDLLDKAGLKPASTPAEFHQLLKDIKKAYPSMIPFGMDNEHPNSHLVSTITSGFGFRGEWMDVSGKPTFYLKNPGFKDYIGYMASLYQEGLLDPDFPALTRRDKFTKMSSLQMVLMDDSWDGCRTYVASTTDADPTSLVEPMPFLKDANGVAHHELANGAEWFAVIPANADHPVDTIKAINEIMKPENQVYLAAGVEGVHFNYDKEGNIIPIQPKFNEDKAMAHLFFTSMRSEVIYNKIWQARLMKNADMYRIAVHSKKFAEQCADNAISPVLFAPAVTVIDNYNALLAYVKDGCVQVITGKKPLSYVDEMIAYWDANGGKEVEKFYADWEAKNK